MLAFYGINRNYIYICFFYTYIYIYIFFIDGHKLVHILSDVIIIIKPWFFRAMQWPFPKNDLLQIDHPTTLRCSCSVKPCLGTEANSWGMPREEKIAGLLMAGAFASDSPWTAKQLGCSSSRFWTTPVDHRCLPSKAGGSCCYKLGPRSSWIV